MTVMCPVTGMCGDVNLYLNDLDDRCTAEIEVSLLTTSPRLHLGPCEASSMSAPRVHHCAIKKCTMISSCLWQIMVAEAGSRRKGIAKEALCIMMLYGMEQLVILSFRQSNAKTEQLPCRMNKIEQRYNSRKLERTAKGSHSVACRV